MVLPNNKRGRCPFTDDVKPIGNQPTDAGAHYSNSKYDETHNSIADLDLKMAKPFEAIGFN